MCFEKLSVGMTERQGEDIYQRVGFGPFTAECSPRDRAISKGMGRAARNDERRIVAE